MSWSTTVSKYLNFKTSLRSCGIAAFLTWTVFVTNEVSSEYSNDKVPIAPLVALDSSSTTKGIINTQGFSAVTVTALS